MHHAQILVGLFPPMNFSCLCFCAGNVLCQAFGESKVFIWRELREPKRCCTALAGGNQDVEEAHRCMHKGGRRKPQSFWRSRGTDTAGKSPAHGACCH